MISRNRTWCCWLFAVGLVGLVHAMPGFDAQNRPGSEKIPNRVRATLKARFPDAVIDKWTREQEGKIVLYDIEFKQGVRKFEADIKEDGTIHNWEMQIAITELPDKVRKAVMVRYPKAVLQEVMAITSVTDGKEALEGYEIVLKAADGKDTEVTAAPDGKILENSGKQK